MYNQIQPIPVILDRIFGPLSANQRHPIREEQIQLQLSRQDNSGFGHRNLPTELTSFTGIAEDSTDPLPRAASRSDRLVDLFL